MSANNKLIVYKNKKGKFIIDNVDVGSGGKFREGETNTFKDARKLVYKIMSETIIEYGVEYLENCFDDNQTLTK
ncbi:MAG: hypothetical protein NT145_03645 [Elusimicrobia bacterium]|nr:hypothetical protein [Elusimicrobiota bacterium]